MAYTSEIDKLERRYAENPQGRNFAPLADAYRKAGQVDQAVELCKSGLERHPDYVSAHIVLGRCLIDKKDDPGAEEVFRKVLDLDPENVIAFKILADIADRGSRYDESVGWLMRLLTADPMNGDAAEALSVAKRKAAAQPAPAISSPPPAAARLPTAPDVPVSAAPPEPVIDLEPPVVEQLVESGEPAAAPPIKSGDLETFDGSLNFSSVANEAAKADGIELNEEIVFKPAPVHVEGLAQTQYEASGVFKVDESGAPPPSPAATDADATGANDEDELPTVDLPLIMPEDLVPRSRHQATLGSVVPDTSSAAASPPPPPPPPPPAFPPLDSASPAPTLKVPTRAAPGRPEPPVAAAVALSDDDGAADTAALSKVEPMLTETMAELFLKQGHQDDARRVYEALLAQRPGDARLRVRVEELKRQLQADSEGGETVRVFLKNILSGRSGGGGVPASNSDSPLDTAFDQAHEGDIPGNPTHAAVDSISLDQVFGEEPAEAQPLRGGTEAQGSSASPSQAAPGQNTGGFSFDDFFGGKPAPGGAGRREGAEGREGGAAPAADTSPAGTGRAGGGGRTSMPRAKAPVEDSGDLDQFQAWLKGLKA